MLNAVELLQAHFQTLVAENVQWQTLIAEEANWEPPFAESFGHATRLSGDQRQEWVEKFDHRGIVRFSIVESVSHSLYRALGTEKHTTSDDFSLYFRSGL